MRFSGLKKLNLPTTIAIKDKGVKRWADGINDTIDLIHKDVNFRAQESYWDDLRFPMASISLGPSTNPPQVTAYKGSVVYSFEDEAVNEDIVYFVAQMPHAWKEGSSLHPHVHWVGEDDTAGNVKWALTYSWANIGEAFPSEETVYSVDANSTTTDAHNLASFTAIDGTGKTLSSMLLCSLRRNSTHADDTLTGKDAILLEVDIHYEIDWYGSIKEYQKWT